MSPHFCLFLRVFQLTRLYRLQYIVLLPATLLLRGHDAFQTLHLTCVCALSYIRTNTSYLAIYLSPLLAIAKLGIPHFCQYNNQPISLPDSLYFYLSIPLSMSFLSLSFYLSLSLEILTQLQCFVCISDIIMQLTTKNCRLLIPQFYSFINTFVTV